MKDLDKEIFTEKEAQAIIDEDLKVDIKKRRVDYYTSIVCFILSFMACILVVLGGIALFL